METRKVGVQIYLLAAFTFGIIVFLVGFFPLSHSSQQDAPIDLANSTVAHEHYRQHYDKVVLLIIDALRLDFVSHMKFTQHQLNEQRGCSFQIKVYPPTVTMPRIKAITSGTIPNFIDVVLNLGSGTMTTDTFLHRLRDQKRNMVFYGDDTWDKLFPDFFLRKQVNTDSLFVNDFHEGDRNITNRLSDELKQSDWTLMILHYLGVDHIGHVEGPLSGKMPAKLVEMDNVIRQIFATLIDGDKQHGRLSKNLLLITGDHGMRDGGGHGGSSFAETHVPMIALGTKCVTPPSRVYPQVDIATTLSILLGLPIPSASIGGVINELLHDFSAEQQLFALHYSSRQLFKKMVSIQKDSVASMELRALYEKAVDEYKLFREANSSQKDIYFTNSKLLFLAVGQQMSETLINEFVRYDFANILLGIAIVLDVFITSGILLLSGQKANPKQAPGKLLGIVTVGSFVVFIVLMHLCGSSDFSALQIVAYLVTTMIIYHNLSLKLIYWSSRIVQNIAKWQLSSNYLLTFVVLCELARSISLASTSFIEEEHQLWYYFVNTLFVLMWTSRWTQFSSWISNRAGHRSKVDQLKTLFRGDDNQLFEITVGWTCFFAAHILSRRLNQTGDKWRAQSDVGDWLNADGNIYWLSLFHIFGLATIFRVSLLYTDRLSLRLLTAIGLFLVYYHKALTGSVYFPGVAKSTSTLWLYIFAINMLEIIAIQIIPAVHQLIRGEQNHKKQRHTLSTVLIVFVLCSSLLHKPHNVLLNALCIASCRLVNEFCDNYYANRPNMALKIIAHLWIGKLFFFQQGNSNSLATIDLNAGFIGHDTYNLSSVAVLIALNTFSAPILSFILLLNHLDVRPHALRSARGSLYAATNCVLMAPFTIYLFVITSFRHHLFVWTVFSPKIIYEFAYLVVIFLLLCTEYVLNKLTC